MAIPDMPAADMIRNALDGALDPGPWNATQRRRFNSVGARLGDLGLTHEDDNKQNPIYREAQAMTGSRSSVVNTIPQASSEWERYEIIQYFEDESWNQLNQHEDLPLGVQYDNFAREPMDFAAEYAKLSEVPTSTTNPLRPRTIAAGYDKDKQVLTVMFRDGTLYNYFAVSPTQWYNFRRARSKGRFILTYLDQKPRGVAEPGSLSPQAAVEFAKIARTAQWAKGGLNDSHSATSRRGGAGSYRRGNLGGSTRKKTPPLKYL